MLPSTAALTAAAVAAALLLLLPIDAAAPLQITGNDVQTVEGNEIIKDGDHQTFVNNITESAMNKVWKFNTGNKSIRKYNLTDQRNPNEKNTSIIWAKNINFNKTNSNNIYDQTSHNTLLSSSYWYNLVKNFPAHLIDMFPARITLRTDIVNNSADKIRTVVQKIDKTANLKTLLNATNNVILKVDNILNMLRHNTARPSVSSWINAIQETYFTSSSTLNMLHQKLKKIEEKKVFHASDELYHKNYI